MNVEELLVQSRQRSGCWANRQTGDPAEYVAAVNAETADGVKHSPKAVRDIIISLGGPALNVSTIKHHLNKGCGCWKS